MVLILNWWQVFRLESETHWCNGYTPRLVSPSSDRNFLLCSWAIQFTDRLCLIFSFSFCLFCFCWRDSSFKDNFCGAIFRFFKIQFILKFWNRHLFCPSCSRGQFVSTASLPPVRSTKLRKVYFCIRFV